MSRILSISYDEALLQTRELLLKEEGYYVESAFGLSAAVKACQQGNFDLVVICHSIPVEDKQEIVKQLNAVCTTAILALQRKSEPALHGARFSIDPGDPVTFLRKIRTIFGSKTQASGSRNN